MKVAVHTTLSRTDSLFCPQHKAGFFIEVMYMDGYCYNVSNKKGKAVDFWIMDKPTPKEANFIFSCRFSRYVKPKSKPIEMMLNDALNQELKSQMPENSQTGEVVRCKDCIYQVKRFYPDKRFKEGGYWDVGCNHFGEIIGYWGWGGNDEQFCSDGKRKGGESL